MPVRVRYAPSPTGMLHVGALRTVLFDHLLAKKLGGVNILRIEDTDRTRYNPDSETEFIETLRWVGIEFGEGPHVGGPNAPYRQSERKDAGIYAKHIQTLLDSGHAYWSFETSDELAEMREFQQINRMPTGYFGGQWRDASPEAVEKARAEGRPGVIRLRMPRGEKIVLHDLVRGRVEWESDTLDDPVLIKADGMPTYHFAAMVDDHLMEITHVLRGDEWIPSAPKHMAIFQAFGWEPPIWVHCPVIVGKDGKKLSKRHGATRVLDYASQGILPHALNNFVALIGWSPGEDREALSESELVEAFDLERIQPSPGKFDIEKLRWLNGHHIRLMDPEQLLEALLAYVKSPTTRLFFETYEADPDGVFSTPSGPDLLRKFDLIVSAAERDRAYLFAAMKEEQERVTTLADFGDALECFLVEEPPMDEKAVAKWFGESHVPYLFDWVLHKLSESRVETVEHYETILRGFQTHQGLEKLGPVVHPMRVALTGKTFGPGLFELMCVLGHDRIQRRLERAKGMIPG